VTEHTPGPWDAEDWTGGFILISAGDSRRIARMDSNVPHFQVLANARLIAAAPEMLERLQRIVAAWKRGDLLDVEGGKFSREIGEANILLASLDLSEPEATAP
jgi:hypothetical protein